MEPGYKYEIIADDLRDRIKKGEFATTKVLPTQKRLVQEYSCSTRTIQRAVDILLLEELVTSKRGSGIFLL